MSDNHPLKHLLGTTSDGEPMFVHQLVKEIGDELTLNAMSREQLTRQYLNKGDRDIWKECGYLNTSQITTDHLYNLFKRDPIANRIITIWPKECWRMKPELYDVEKEDVESDFEGAFKDMCRGLNGQSFAAANNAMEKFWSILQQADILTGVGYFGALVIGIDDNMELDQPVAGFEDDNLNPEYTGLTLNEKKEEMRKKAKRELLYLQPYSHVHLDVAAYELRSNHRRYGMPTYYTVKNTDAESKSVDLHIPEGTKKIHWSRVVHLVDSPYESDAYSDPRVLNVYNRLYDLSKLFGGSAEMYWLGALPGLKFTPKDKDIKITEESKKEMKAAVDLYLNKLKRFLASETMDINTLSPQVVSPTSQIEVQIEAICIAGGYPKRIFIGSERGELASSQDQLAFDARVEARCTGQINPRLISPLIDRLILMGVLPMPQEDGFKIHWEPHQKKTEQEKATVATSITTALVQYVKSGLSDLITPLDYLVKIQGFEADEAIQLLENTKKANAGAHKVPPPEERVVSEKKDPKKKEDDPKKKGSERQEKETGDSPEERVKAVVANSLNNGELSLEQATYAYRSADGFGYAVPVSSFQEITTNGDVEMDVPFDTPDHEMERAVFTKAESGALLLVRWNLVGNSEDEDFEYGFGGEWALSDATSTDSKPKTKKRIPFQTSK